MLETCLILIKYSVEGDLRRGETQGGDEDVSVRMDYDWWDQIRWTVYYARNTNY